MGKPGLFGKVLLIIGILLMIVSGSLIAFVFSTRSKEIWTAKANSLSAPATVSLKDDTYIFGADYTFNYIEEHTMAITLILTNNVTLAVTTLEFSVSPQSSYVETITDGAASQMVAGNYEITYSCESAYFSATSCRFRIIKPGLFRDTVNPEGTFIGSSEQTWEMVGEYSIPGVLLGFLLFFIGGLVFLVARRSNKSLSASGSQQVYYTPTYQQQVPPPAPPSPSQSYSSSQWQQPIAEPPPKQSEQYTSYWRCIYCNTINDIKDHQCIYCQAARQD
ncbi:MAG: hypothetical protein FK734_05045 [Asgard group archaeon]|nr:hypothetical protein [Asgard group archaeon]